MSQTSTAGAAIGACVALNLRVLIDACGAGPAAMIGALAGPFLLLSFLPAARGAGALVAILGGAFFFGFEDLTGTAARWLDVRTAVITVDLLALAALLSPLARIEGPFGAPARLAGAAVGGLVFLLPRELAAAITVIAVLFVARRGGARARAPWAAGRSVLAGISVAVAVAAWTVARSPLDPTGTGWAILAGGLAVGSCVAGAPALISGLLVLGAAGAAWAAGPAWIDGHLAGLGGAVFAAGLGLGGGALIGAARPGRGFGVGTLAAAATLWLLPLLPAGLITPSARSLATFGHDALARARTEALRAASVPSAVTLGPSGTTALWTSERGAIADLDGTAADPTSRAGDAETFAGTLGACLAPGRTRARIGGDDLALVTRAVTAQGFLSVDVSVPDLAFARAHAERMPAVKAAWLSPAVRAIGVPAPMLLRFGAPADLVVQVARTGWTDGRNTVPDRRGFAAVRGNLLPGGVFVLAVGTTRLAQGDFGRIVDDLLAIFPDVTVWSPPAGVDSAVFVARAEAAPVPWAGLVACARADADGLRAVGMRGPLDIGGRLIAGREALTRLAVPGRPPLSLPVIEDDPPLPLLDVDGAAFDPASWFGGDTPVSELRARHASQREFFGLVRDRDSGSIQQAITRARMLGAGNSQVIATLVRPHLERARAAMNRAAAEGIGSHAWQEAETSLTNAELIAPGFGETACARGRFAEMKSDVSQAEAAYQACVTADPENLVGLDGVARTARIRGDLPAAEAALRKAYALAPDRTSTAYNLGQLLAVSGNYEEAERLLKTAARAAARETPVPAMPNVALAYLYLATRRPGLALSEAERAKSLDPGAEPRMLAGAAHLGLNNLRAADAELRAALAIDPEYLPARGELGRVQALAGQYALAAASFKAVLERDPGNVAARENLRAVQAELGVANPEPGR